MILHDWSMLPGDRLPDIGAWSTQFRARGARTLRDAGRVLQEMAYGRLAEGHTYRQVLHDGRGTCSTKHAVLAEVATEAGVAALLTVGLYDMCEANTPGVGDILTAAGLPSIPEAHCYVILDGDRIDVTRARTIQTYDIGEIHDEFVVEPEELATHKESIHREFLSTWMAAHPALVDGRGEVEMWNIRELCIAALAE